MRWHFPALLLTVFLTALVVSIGMIQGANDAFSWMIAFGMILLSIFGVFFMIIWLLVALAGQRPKPVQPPQPSIMSDNRLQQSEFSRAWLQTRRTPATYDENVKTSRERGIQTPHRLVPREESAKKDSELWHGFRNINQKHTR